MASIIQSVYECAMKKDSVALEICNTIAAEIASSAIAVITKLQMQKETFDVALAGSIHKENGKVLKPLISRIVKSVAPHANVYYPAFPPVVGAVLLAMEERDMKITAQHYENIRRTIKIMEKKQHRQL